MDSAKNASLATVDQIDDGKKDAAQIANTTSVQAQIADGGEHTAGTDSAQENETEADGRHTREVSTERDAMTEDTQEVLSGSVISPTVQFTEDSSLSWPAAGSILMDYSMDGTVYFQTLNEYKYNPALIIGSQTGNPVVAAAKGIVESIDTNEETGTTLTMCTPASPSMAHTLRPAPRRNHQQDPPFRQSAAPAAPCGYSVPICGC